jgi:hypothetical protein
VADARLHWIYQVGGLLVALAMMTSVPILLLPLFDEQRGTAFWIAVVPLAVAGGAMIAYQHYRSRSKGRGAPNR